MTAGHAPTKAATVETASAQGVDPVDELRAEWRTQIEFGVANPAVFRLSSDPDRVRLSPTAQSGKRALEARVHRLAVTGRLQGTEQRAADLIQAAGTGVIHGDSSGDRAPTRGARRGRTMSTRRMARPRAGHQQTKPQSATRSSPVQAEEAREARKIAGPTSSAMSTMRPIGVWSSHSALAPATSGRCVMGVRV